MIQLTKRFALPLLLGTLLTPLAGHAQEQKVKATHGSWQVICLGDTDACAMQQVGKSPKGEDAMVVRISKVEAKDNNGGNIPATIEVVAPLGVILPAGLRVQIDGGEVRGTGFQVCLQNGCLAQDSMNDQFLADLRKGSTAKMTVVVPRQGEVPINISLSGFTKAFGSLKPLNQQRQ